MIYELGGIRRVIFYSGRNDVGVIDVPLYAFLDVMYSTRTHNALIAGCKSEMAKENHDTNRPKNRLQGPSRSR